MSGPRGTQHLFHVYTPLCHSFKNPRMNAEIEGQIKKRNKRETRLERRNSRRHAVVRKRSSEQREENSPIWYLIGIDPVEKLNFSSGQIHTLQARSDARHLWARACMPVFCAKIWSLATQKQEKKKGGEHTMSHTLEEERRAETDKEQEWRGNKEKKCELKKRNTGRNKDRELLIFLRRWFIYPPYGSSARPANQCNEILNKGRKSSEEGYWVWAYRCRL